MTAQVTFHGSRAWVARLLNAAAAIVVAGKAKDIKEGLAVAAKSLDSAEAEGRLDRLIAVSNST